MTFGEYQAAAWQTADYPDQGQNLIYPALGLAGEAGEVADKIKKLWRNKGKTSPKQLTCEESNELVKEIGDVMWYCAALCNEMGLHMGAVAQINIDKLLDRKARGVIKSEGDNR